MNALRLLPPCSWTRRDRRHTHPICSGGARSRRVLEEASAISSSCTIPERGGVGITVLATVVGMRLDRPFNLMDSATGSGRPRRGSGSSARGPRWCGTRVFRTDSMPRDSTGGPPASRSDPRVSRMNLHQPGGNPLPPVVARHRQCIDVEFRADQPAGAKGDHASRRIARDVEPRDVGLRACSVERLGRPGVAEGVGFQRDDRREDHRLGVRTIVRSHDSSSLSFIQTPRAAIGPARHRAVGRKWARSHAAAPRAPAAPTRFCRSSPASGTAVRRNRHAAARRRPDPVRIANALRRREMRPCRARERIVVTPRFNDDLRRSRDQFADLGPPPRPWHVRFVGAPDLVPQLCEDLATLCIHPCADVLDLAVMRRRPQPRKSKRARRDDPAPSRDPGSPQCRRAGR